MISELTFSKKYTSFWNEILPNSKSYIRLVNEGLKIADYEPLEPADRKENTALINVMAFETFRRVAKKTLTFKRASSGRFYSEQDGLDVVSSAAAYLSRFNYGEEVRLPLSPREHFQAQQIFTVLCRSYLIPSGKIVVDPLFDGCGYINAASGDIFANNTLIEIKSGERRFSITDVRQILIYCALNHFSRVPLSIRRVELFNPRMGITFNEDIGSLCRSISALSPIELFSEIQKYISEDVFVEAYGA